MIRRGGIAAVAVSAVLLIGAAGCGAPEEVTNPVPPAPNPPPEGGGRILDPEAVPDPVYVPMLEDAAQTCAAIDGPSLAAQIHAESQWNPRAQSPAGAQGISQFMPGTWAMWGSDHSGDGVADVWDPADAIGSQADLMCYLSGWVDDKLAAGVISGEPFDLTLAAYNAGEGTVEDAGGVPNITETKVYIAKINSLIPDYTLTPEGGPVAEYAKPWLGTPYIWGGGDINGPTTGTVAGETRKGFDCSGLTLYAMYHASGGAIELPHQAFVQATMGSHVDPTLNAMRPGDLVFFALGRLGPTIDHVGIYMGEGQMIHATRPCSTCEGEVRIDNLTDPFWASQQWTVRRYMYQED